MIVDGIFLKHKRPFYDGRYIYVAMFSLRINPDILFR